MMKYNRFNRFKIACDGSFHQVVERTGAVICDVEMIIIRHTYKYRKYIIRYR